MDKKVFVVNIDVAESDEMQKLWYEYNATMNNITFLMSQDGVKKEILQEYIDTAELRWVKQQMLKEKLANKYKPDVVDLDKYNYGYDFDEHTIKYDEA